MSKNKSVKKRLKKNHKARDLLLAIQNSELKEIGTLIGDEDSSVQNIENERKIAGSLQDNTNIADEKYTDLLLQNQFVKIELEALNISKKNELEKIQKLEEKEYEINIQLISLKNELAKVHSTITYQLGYQIILGFSSFKNFLYLPQNLLGLYKRSRKVKNKRKEKILVDQQIHQVPYITHEKMIVENKPEILALIDKDWLLENLILSSDNKKNLKVACIMDDFTFNSYKYECDLYQISKDNWQSDLEAIQPELLFIESAWRGVDEQWYNLINKNVEELQSIVEWCKEKKIPTVFWNKEDPIHFQTFLNTAQQFDYVFTTDIDCVPRYQEALGHKEVYFLPFACQPVVNNPIELYERRESFCFAGAYYVKYPERTADLGNIVASLGEYKGVEIYDRNFYKTDPDYKFPEDYQPYIVGNLPFSEIDKAYKGYKFSINLNSIKQSQTMFARRIYELLGSNTITVSNFSKGVRTLFGDLVFTSDSGDELVKRLDTMLSDELAEQKHRLLGLRKVMLEHTYERRLNYILSKAIQDYEDVEYLPTISIIAVVDNLEALNLILASFDRQSYASKKLILINKTDTLILPSMQYIKNYSLRDAENELLINLIDTEYVTLFCAKDYYSENYLLDLALATKYSQAYVFGKAKYYEKKIGELTLNSNGIYCRAMELAACSSLINKSVVTNIKLREFIENYVFKLDKMLSIDPFNYCKNGAELTSEQLLIINDLTINSGLNLNDIIELSENVPKVAEDSDVNGNLLAYHPEEISQLFLKVQRENIRINAGKNGFVIQSEFNKDQHDYIYASKYIAFEDLPFTQDSQLYFECTGIANMDLQCAVLFYDKDKSRLGHQIIDINKVSNINLPFDKTKYLQLGFRIKGAGSAIIKKISFTNLEYIQITEKQNAERNIFDPIKIQDIFQSSGTEAIGIDSLGGEYAISSTLEDNKHEYVYAKQLLTKTDISPAQEIPLYLDISAGLDIQLAILFFDENKQRLGHQMEYPRTNTTIKPIEGTKYFKLGWRVRGSGKASIHNIYFKHQNIDPSLVFSQSNTLVLTNNYPSYQDLYKNAFVHSRVKAYKAEGINVDVFRFISKDTAVTYHEFEDVDVINGSQKLLDTLLKSRKYKKILVHFLDENMWNILKNYIDDIQVIVWIHGSDIQPWWRRKFNYEGKTDSEMLPVKASSAKKEAFWKALLAQPPKNLSFVFVSQQFADEVMQDYDAILPKDKYHIIHNYIDNNVFQYQEKPVEMRKNILSIRPFSSKTYANDLTVNAILELSKEPWFNELNFTIIGDGPLFDELTEPLTKFSNVRLEKKFLNQQQIIEEHKKHGVFLVPTRMDTQGVSRGEAMSSGLVAITNNTAAIPDFCSAEDTILVEPEDYIGLAKGIVDLFKNEKLFEEISKKGSLRVLSQCGYQETIMREIKVMK